MERQIGEIFDCNRVPLVAVEESDFDCEGCFFRDTAICFKPDIIDIIGSCSGDLREDGKDVIFKKVE